MSTKIFVNLPVSDLTRSIKFFTELGLVVQQEYTNDDAGCLVVNDAIYVLLVTEPFFKTITGKNVADTGTAAETVLALQVDSRQRVDELTDKALANGGQPVDEHIEDVMYSRGFHDPDGHIWNVVYM